jgi:predicted homoserine dehydrogenase-like protein
MYEIDKRLLALEKEGKPIKVSLIGTGQMGTEIVIQVGMMTGMEIVAAVDLYTSKVVEAYRMAGYDGKIVETNDLAEAEKAVKEGAKVATTDYNVAVKLSEVHAVIDATGSPQMGADISLLCFENHKHIVMMNVECDITIGPILREKAEKSGVIYSIAAGDEPGAIMELYRFAHALGFKIVAAGKGKNNPLDIYATPSDEEWAAKASARNMSARMLIEFVDGSKTMVEMAAVSNATGLVPDVRGMHGPKANIEDLTTVFSLKEQGGILNKEGVVDYGIGNINPGVFVIIQAHNEKLREGMAQRDMGPGPNYLLLRPYHLCSVEVPLTVAQAVIYNESTGYPGKKLTSECITVAKQNLKAGQVLDRIGEPCYRASIDLYEVAKAGNMLPVGLAHGAKLLCDVSKDTIITYDMVELIEDSTLVKLRRMQDQTM